MNEFGVLQVPEQKRTIMRSVIKFFIRQNPGDKSMFDRFGARVMRRGQKSIADAGVAADGMAIYRPGGSQTVPASKAMDSHFGWVYACVKAISDEMANIQFRLFSIDTKGEHQEVEQHDLLDLIEGVNESQSGAEFRKVLASHLELTGNAYLYLFGVKSFDDQPKAMYLLNPGQTKAVISKTTFPYQVVRYEMVDEHKKFVFQPYEVIHFKYPDPNDQQIGIGTVQGIAEWIDNDNYAMEFNRNFFRNGARMSGVFKTPYTSIEQTQRLKTAFDEQFGGVKNAYKVMIMPKDVEWIPTQMTAKDMDFANLLDTTAQRILAGFRVSHTILGTAESDTNRATAETADYVFAKRTIKPKMEIITATFNEFLVPRFGENLYLGFDDPVPEDKAFRTTEMQTAVGGKQVITQNEAREQFMGLGPLDDPAADRINGAGAPAIEPNGDEDDEDDQKSLKKKNRIVRTVKYFKSGKSFKTQFSRNKESRKELAKDMAEAMAKALLAIKKKDIVAMSDDEYVEAFYPAIKARIDEYEPKIRQAIAHVATKQEKVVLKNLPNAVKSVVPSKLFDMTEWIGITVGAVEPIMEELFGSEFKATAEAAGTPEAQISDHIAASLESRMQLLGQSYNQTIIDELTTKLNAGLSQGFSRAQLADSVKDIYSWSRDYQAERIAKTETVAVSNMANKAAWQAGGRVATVKWYTSQKDNVCPFCQEMAGTEIDINQNFLDLGDEFTGSDGKTMTASYSAIGGPPLHPNCGCILRPASYNPLKSMKTEKSDVDEALDEIKKLDHEN